MCVYIPAGVHRLGFIVHAGGEVHTTEAILTGDEAGGGQSSTH